MGHPLNSQPSQEYPIRALVRAENLSTVHQSMVGRVYHWRKIGDSYETPCALEACDCNKKLTWCAREAALIFDPTPEQIAEERAKADLPAETAPDVPERSEGFPSLPSDLMVEVKATLQAALFAIGSPGANTDIHHSMRPVWEGIRSTLSKLEGR